MAIKKLDFKFINEIHRNDHIKEIMDAVNSNADELSATENNVASLRAGYSSDVASTKKIYYHPIYFSSSLGEKIQFVILDNNATAYTLANITSKIYELLDLGAIINVNGFILSTDATPVKSNVYMLYRPAPNEYYVYYWNDNNDGGVVALSTFLSRIGYFQDGVNAIN